MLKERVSAQEEFLMIFLELFFWLKFYYYSSIVSQGLRNILSKYAAANLFCDVNFGSEPICVRLPSILSLSIYC